MNAVDFYIHYPIFSGISDVVIQSELNFAYELLPADKWTNTTIREKAQGLMTAHVLALRYRDQLILGGVLRGYEEGKEIDLSDIIEWDDEWWRLTIYGREYLNLRNRMLGVSMFVV